MKNVLAYAIIVSSVMACICSPNVHSRGRAMGALPTGLDGTESSYEDILRSLQKSPLQAVVESSQPATLGLEDLHRACSAWQSGIQSALIHFTYKRDSELDVVEEQQREHAKSPGPHHASYRIAFAMKGDRRYNAYTDLTELEKPDFKRFEKEPMRVMVFDGQKMQDYQATSKVGVVYPELHAGMEIVADRYFAMIGYPLCAWQEKTPNDPAYLLSMPDHYKVQNNLQMVDGFPCHVVSSDSDTLWIDHIHGGAVRRRVALSRTTIDDPGCLAYMKVCKDLVEPARGIWLPTTCVLVNYATQDRPPSQRGKVRQIERIDVSQLRVNDVADSAFEFVLPPGTVVMDRIADKEYIMPEGIDSLDEVIAQAKPLVGDSLTLGPDQRVGPMVPRGYPRSAVVVVAVLVLLLLILATLGAIRVFTHSAGRYHH